MAAAVTAPFPVERGIAALVGAKTQTEPTAMPMRTKMRSSVALDTFPDAGTTVAVIVELLTMSYMCMQVETPTSVSEGTAKLSAPVSTVPCTASSKLPHAPTADAVIVQLLWKSDISVEVVMPMAVMEESPLLAAPVSTVRCTATSNLPHAPTADAVIVEML